MSPIERPPELLDTSVAVRYLTGDPPAMAARAAAIIESGHPLRLSLVVLAELGFVLTRRYGIGRQGVVAALIELLQRSNVEAHEIPTDRALAALALCAPSGRVSFADAMLWALAGSADATVWTFDRRFPSDGIARREP